MGLLLEDAFLPATLSADPMTDDEFLAFCDEHPDLTFETNASGEIVVMAPTNPMSADRNAGIASQLYDWTEKDGRGRSYDSSAFFVLPNGARRSPDASWISKDRIDQFAPADLEESWRLCPEFVIELKSASDRAKPLRDKMLEYIANGAQLGWLMDPKRRSVTVFRPNQDPEELSNIDSIAGEGPVNDFVLELAAIWNPFARLD